MEITSLQNMFGVLAGAALLIGMAPYVKSIHRREIKPHSLSWIGWGFVTGIGALAMLSEGFTWGVVILTVNTLACFFVAIYSQARGVGVWKASRYDWLFFILGALGIILWQILRNPDLAVTFAIIADASFGIPTLIKMKKDPHSETRFPWLMAALSGILGLVAISYVSYTEIAYPIYLAAYDVTAFAFVWFGQINTKTNQSIGNNLFEANMKNHSTSLSEFNTIARQILAELLETPADQPVVVGLVGDLGAGKTTLVQTWAKELGVDRVVTSPTFTLVQTYETNSPRFSTLVHADLYRLEEDRELKTVGGDQWGSDPAQLVVVEWPHQIPSMADKLTKVITITEPTPESREIIIS